MDDPINLNAIEPAAEGQDRPDLRPVVMAGPIDIRSVALVVLLVFAILFILSWAKAVLITLVFSVLVSYSLDPIVTGMERLKIPRALGAALLLCALIALIGYGSQTLRGQAETILDKIPEAVDNVKESIRAYSRYTEGGIIDKAKEAANEIQQATAIGGEKPPPPGVTRVQIEEPAFDIREYVIWGSMGALALMGQIATVVVLVYFFLVSGDLYKRKLVTISGPALSKKKITVQIIDDFNAHIRRYLFILLMTAVFDGVLAWLIFLWIGLEQAALWGVITGVASAIPYLGPTIAVSATGLMGFLQFGTVTMALMVACVPLLVTGIEGSLLTPWVTSRAAKINTVAVFIGLLFWSWLWGPIGLIVGTPILIIIKVCCDHIENLKPISELLGD